MLKEEVLASAELWSLPSQGGGRLLPQKVMESRGGVRSRRVMEFPEPGRVRGGWEASYEVEGGLGFLRSTLGMQM